MSAAGMSALEVLRAEPLPLFALVDAARAPEAWLRLLQAGVPLVSLFEGREAGELADVAPYLAPLTAAPELLEALLTEFWGEAAGLYLSSPATLEELREHLRTLFLATVEEEVYFRFYDPRVLRLYLPTLDAAQAEHFLGPVAAVLLEDDDGGLLRFSLGSDAPAPTDAAADAGG